MLKPGDFSRPPYVQGLLQLILMRAIQERHQCYAPLALSSLTPDKQAPLFLPELPNTPVQSTSLSLTHSHLTNMPTSWLSPLGSYSASQTKLLGGGCSASRGFPQPRLLKCSSKTPGWALKTLESETVVFSEIQLSWRWAVTVVLLSSTQG